MLSYSGIASLFGPACFSKFAIRFSNLETWFCVYIEEKKKAMGRNATNDNNPGGKEIVLRLQP